MENEQFFEMWVGWGVGVTELNGTQQNEMVE